eukprot:GHRQ01018632.1.p1 GENE.GHRQ01018632.1~~GHRQ01018632.1.p1  ORF type:complete len:164 (+),score=8.01 GHRQ01018632.1:123-614(+)
MPVMPRTREPIYTLITSCAVSRVFNYNCYLYTCAEEDTASCRLSCGDLNALGLWLGLRLCLGHLDAQHALVQAGGDLVLLDRLGQRKAARELGEVTLAAHDLALALISLLLCLLAADGEHPVSHLHVDVRGAEAGCISVQQVGVLGLYNVLQAHVMSSGSSSV